MQVGDRVCINHTVPDYAGMLGKIARHSEGTVWVTLDGWQDIIDMPFHPHALTVVKGT